jgi:serine/threonine-protein kinase
MTAEGTVLGTLQYMAPEQVEGKTNEIDARTDIFAFGAVVYEMATGKKAFEGKTQASLIAKILETEPPPMSVIQPMTPPALDRVVKKCLAKEPEKRWQSASDVCDELKWIAEESPPGAFPAAVPFTSHGRNWFGAALWLGAALAACIVVCFAVWILKPVAAPPVTRTVIALPPDQQFASADQPLVAISPDGKELAYIADLGGIPQLFVRAMDGLEARVIPGTYGAFSPSFSPDSQWLGFFQSGSLKKLSVSGGAGITLSPAILGNGPFGFSWSSQGTIIFSPFGQGPLHQISDQGGNSVALTKMENADVTHRWPEVLPGGQAVLFVGASGPTDIRIAVRSLRTREQRNLVQGGTYPSYAPTGHLIYAQGATLMAAPFDLERLQIRGAAVPMIEGLVVAQNGAAQYSFSHTGTLVYVSGGSTTAQRKLVWVNRNGSEQVLGAPVREYGYPRISPDGKRVAVEVESQIWLYDLARDTLSRFTFEGSTNQNPAWTPDGKRIAFYSNKDGPANIFWQLADGSGGLERLGTSQNGQVPRSFSPDGQVLAFHENNPVTKKDIWILRLNDRKAEPFLRTAFNEGGPTFSPDGHWLAYISDESGRQEIYVQPYPGSGGKYQISTEGGSEPAWNRNGRELFYRSGAKMMAVELATQPTFSAGKPKVLFEGRYFAIQPPLTGTAYDVSPDGQRFLMVKENEAATSRMQINVVQNWFEELKRRVPAGK